MENKKSIYISTKCSYLLLQLILLQCFNRALIIIEELFFTLLLQNQRTICDLEIENEEEMLSAFKIYDDIGCYFLNSDRKLVFS